MEAKENKIQIPMGKIALSSHALSTGRYRRVRWCPVGYFTCGLSVTLRVGVVTARRRKAGPWTPGVRRRREKTTSQQVVHCYPTPRSTTCSTMVKSARIRALRNLYFPPVPPAMAQEGELSWHSTNRPRSPIRRRHATLEDRKRACSRIATH
jgi:hypothetical protein